MAPLAAFFHEGIHGSGLWTGYLGEHVASPTSHPCCRPAVPRQKAASRQRQRRPDSPGFGIKPVDTPTSPSLCPSCALATSDLQKQTWHPQWSCGQPTKQKWKQSNIKIHLVCWLHLLCGTQRERNGATWCRVSIKSTQMSRCPGRARLGLACALVALRTSGQTKTSARACAIDPLSSTCVRGICYYYVLLCFILPGGARHKVEAIASF